MGRTLQQLCPILTCGKATKPMRSKLLFVRVWPKISNTGYYKQPKMIQNANSPPPQVRLGPDLFLSLSWACFSSSYTTHLLPLLAQDGTVSREGKKYLSKQDPTEGGREKEGKTWSSPHPYLSFFPSFCVLSTKTTMMTQKTRCQ